jgi:hypothetical protein
MEGNQMTEKKHPDMQHSDLSDRESVRTTFRFTKEALEALGWLSERHGVPMKDVLHFALDVLHSAIGQLIKDKGKIDIKKVNEETIRRTVVVTKKTLIYLNKLTKQYNIARDDLINKAILFTKIFTCSTDESTIKVYREAFNLINSYYLEGQGVESKLRDLLGDDDLIVNKFEVGVTGIMSAYIKVEEELNKRAKSINAGS